MAKLHVGGGSLLVAGTSVGAGMLGLPVVAGAAGFIPALFTVIFCWGFMCMTGLLYAELACTYKDDANILSMAGRTLGRIGKPITLAVYLFFFYSLTVAYFIIGGDILSLVTPSVFGVQERIFLFACLFVPVVAVGKRLVDPCNRLCMWGLFAAYFCFIGVGASSVHSENLWMKEWSVAAFVMPVAFASFGFQGTIPTLASWMGYDIKNIKKSIVIGTLITLAIYIVWLLLILGIVPYVGDGGLQDALSQGYDAIKPLERFTNNRAVVFIGQSFAFFALVTSFLGVGSGLVDFVADACRFDVKTKKARLTALAIAFFPPLVFSCFYPHIFLEALGYAGGFGSALLLGALPIAMVFFAKYRYKTLTTEAFYTKKWALTALFICVLFEIGCECIHLLVRNQ